MTDPALPFELGVVSLGNRAFEGNNNSYLLYVGERHVVPFQARS